MATRKGKKNGVAGQKIKGVLDMSSGQFLPYPLPISSLEIYDESCVSVDMSVSKDDPKVWGDGKGETTPLAIEFKVRFFINESDGRYLLRRARILGVEPEKLSEKATLAVSGAEEEAIFKALEAIRGALWYPMLRWAHLLESEAPIPHYCDEHDYWDLQHDNWERQKTLLDARPTAELPGGHTTAV